MKTQGNNDKHKLDLIKIKNFYTLKDIIERVKRQCTEWEKNICKSDKRLVFRLYQKKKNFYNSTSKTQPIYLNEQRT